MSFAFGRPYCGRAFRCVAAPNLRTCLVFALRTCVGAPNLQTFLALRWGTQPWCGRIKNSTLRCLGAPNLRTCLVLHLGTHIADAPCFALGCSTLVRLY